MNEEIEKIIYDLEGCCGMFDYMLTPIENNLLVSYIKQLQQENQQLKRNCNIGYEELNFYRGEYKKIKPVLDEIKEQLKLERKLALSLNKPYTVSVIDKLLDKVKE